MRAILLSATFLFWISLLQAQTNGVNPTNKQVLALLNQGRFVEAVDLGTKALADSEEKFGPESAATAESLNNLGGAYESLGQSAKAEPYYLRGLAIREKVLGPEHPFTARTLNNLAMLYLRTADYPKAEQFFQRSLAINEKVLGPDSVATLKDVGELGLLYEKMGDYGKAEPFLLRCFNTSERTLGAENRQTITSLNNLASYYGHLGNYTKAESLFQQALTIREKVDGTNSPHLAVTLANLAGIRLSMGDAAKSESYFKRSLAILDNETAAKPRLDLANACQGLAMLYIDIGSYPEAGPLLQRALKIQEEILGPDHPVTAGTLSELAKYYDRSGDYSKVEPLYLRVLEIQKKKLGPEHPEIASTLLDLGITYQKAGDYPRAERFLQQALSIAEKALGTNHPSVAICLNDLGALYMKKGDSFDAIPLFERAVNIREKAFGLDNAVTAAQVENLAFAYFDEHQKAPALEMAIRAEKARLGVLANILSFASEQQRLVYEAKQSPYNLLATLDSPAQLAKAVLRNKGVVLDSLLEDHLVAEASKNPEDLALVEKLGPAKQRLTQMILQSPTNFAEDSLNQRAAERQRLMSEVEQLEGTLGRKVASLGRARRALGVTVDEVQKALPEKAALVEFFRYGHYLGISTWESRYGAVVLAPSGDAKWVSLGSSARIEEYVRLVQESVRGRTNGTALMGGLTGLYRKVWAPVESLLPPENKTVIISPDAALNFVSFATLLAPDNKFLAENYSICYVTSGRDLLREQKAVNNNKMTIFGNPDFKAGSSGLAGSNLRPLLGTEIEAGILEMQAKMNNWPVEVYEGTNATEVRLRSLHSPRILHFATHGFFLPETIGGRSRLYHSTLSMEPDLPEAHVVLSNPMLRSGIALSGAQTTLDAWKRGEVPFTDGDGIVTAEEVGSLDLKGTWLVTLSACDTGIGELSAGEGVLGLRRGFVQSGAENLVMSLWPVLDKSTGEFMADFYSDVQKTGNPPEALADVQRKWLVNLHKRQGLLAAVIVAGPFILNFQGPLPQN